MFLQPVDWKSVNAHCNLQPSLCSPIGYIQRSRKPISPQGAKFLGLMSSVQLLGVCFNKSLQAAYKSNLKIAHDQNLLKYTIYCFLKKNLYYQMDW